MIVSSLIKFIFIVFDNISEFIKKLEIMDESKIKINNIKKEVVIKVIVKIFIEKVNISFEAKEVT